MISRSQPQALDIASTQNVVVSAGSSSPQPIIGHRGDGQSSSSSSLSVAAVATGGCCTVVATEAQSVPSDISSRQYSLLSTSPDITNSSSVATSAASLISGVKKVFPSAPSQLQQPSVFSSRGANRGARKTPTFSITVPEREVVAPHVQRALSGAASASASASVSCSSCLVSPQPSSGGASSLVEGGGLGGGRLIRGGVGGAATASHQLAATHVSPIVCSPTPGDASFCWTEVSAAAPAGVGVGASAAEQKQPIGYNNNNNNTNNNNNNAVMMTPTGYHEVTFGRTGFHATRLLPLLYLGSEGDAGMHSELRHRGIKRVLNVAFDCPPQDYSAVGIELLHVPLRDCGDENIGAHFSRLCAWIHDGITKGEGVLVHCRLGVSRSATIVIAYLMTYGIASPTQVMVPQSQQCRATPISEQREQGACRTCAAHGRHWGFFEDNTERINRGEFHVHPEESRRAEEEEEEEKGRESEKAKKDDEKKEEEERLLLGGGTATATATATASNSTSTSNGTSKARPHRRYCFTDYNDVFSYVVMRREMVSPNLGFAMQLRRLNVDHGYPDFFTDLTCSGSDDFCTAFGTPSSHPAVSASSASASSAGCCASPCWLPGQKGPQFGCCATTTTTNSSSGTCSGDGSNTTTANNRSAPPSPATTTAPAGSSMQWRNSTLVFSSGACSPAAAQPTAFAATAAQPTAATAAITPAPAAGGGGGGGAVLGTFASLCCNASSEGMGMGIPSCSSTGSGLFLPTNGATSSSGTTTPATTAAFSSSFSYAASAATIQQQQQQKTLCLQQQQQQQRIILNQQQQHVLLATSTVRCDGDDDNDDYDGAVSTDDHRHHHHRHGHGHFCSSPIPHCQQKRDAYTPNSAPAVV